MIFLLRWANSELFFNNIFKCISLGWCSMTREAVRIIQVPRLLLQFDRTCTYVSCTIGSLIPNSLCLAISMWTHLVKVQLNGQCYCAKNSSSCIELQSQDMNYV